MRKNLIGKNIAFIHIPRTGGTYIWSYLSSVLKRESCRIYTSWGSGLDRDWTQKELLSLLEPNPWSKCVHNHVENWESNTFYNYKRKGWFVFTFIRHPGDRLCSEYFCRIDIYRDRYGLTLDEFIKKNLLEPRKANTIPSYWRDFDYIAEFSHENFADFLKKYFNHKYFPKEPELVSPSKGYNYYCQTGEISKSTQKLLKESEQYKIYSKIKRKFDFQDLFKKKDNIIDDLLDNYPVISKMMTKEQIAIVLENLKIVLDNRIKGDIVELGCHQGTTSLFVQRLLKKHSSNKKFHVYDSFEGLPDKGERDKSDHPYGSYFQKGVAAISKDKIIENFKKAKLKPPIIHTGWFKDAQYPDKIAFAFLDGDFYNSIMDSLEKVYPRLTSGARIVIDDYGWEPLPGVEKACRDFLRDKPEKDTIVAEWGEAVLIKKGTKKPSYFKSLIKKFRF